MRTSSPVVGEPVARRRRAVVASTVAVLLVVAVPATAHVGVTPRELGSGTTNLLEIAVPGERDDAETVEVSVELPDGLIAVAVEPVEGWTASATTTTLDDPLELDGCTVTEVLDVVTWSGGTIPTDGTGIFPLVATVPAEPGPLAFPALQVYDTGEEVAWIGDPGSDNSAARIEVVPAADAEPGDAALTCPPGAPATSAAGDGADDEPDASAATAGDGVTRDDGAGSDGDTDEDVADVSATDEEVTAGDGPEVVAADGTPMPDDESSGVLPVLAIALVVAVVTVATIVVRRR